MNTRTHVTPGRYRRGGWVCFQGEGRTPFIVLPVAPTRWFGGDTKASRPAEAGATSGHGSAYAFGSASAHKEASPSLVSCSMTWEFSASQW